MSYNHVEATISVRHAVHLLNMKCKRQPYICSAQAKQFLTRAKDISKNGYTVYVLTFKCHNLLVELMLATLVVQ